MDALTESRYFEATLVDTRKLNSRKDTRDLRLTLEEIQVVSFALDHYSRKLDTEGFPSMSKEAYNLSAAFNNVLCRAFGITEAPGYAVLEVQEDRPE